MSGLCYPPNYLYVEQFWHCSVVCLFSFIINFFQTRCYEYHLSAKQLKSRLGPALCPNCLHTLHVLYQQYNTNLLAYQQNTMPLAIYNTKQYDIHLLSLLYKTTSTGGCRDKRHHSIRHQYIYACSNAYLLETGWDKLRCLRRLCNRTCQVRIT